MTAGQFFPFTITSGGMMRKHVPSIATCLVTAFLLAGVHCTASAKDPGKIPVTTSSVEARKEFLQGRDLLEKLRAQNSIVHFQNATAKDPKFAQA